MGHDTMQFETMFPPKWQKKLKVSKMEKVMWCDGIWPDDITAHMIHLSTRDDIKCASQFNLFG